MRTRHGKERGMNKGGADQSGLHPPRLGPATSSKILLPLSLSYHVHASRPPELEHCTLDLRDRNLFEAHALRRRERRGRGLGGAPTQARAQHRTRRVDGRAGEKETAGEEEAAEDSRRRRHARECEPRRAGARADTHRCEAALGLGGRVKLESTRHRGLSDACSCSCPSPALALNERACRDGRDSGEGARLMSAWRCLASNDRHIAGHEGFRVHYCRRDTRYHQRYTRSCPQHTSI
jgi:hypothetical protein